MKTSESKKHSLSAKTLHSTIFSCIIFGLVAQIVSLTFYAVSLTNRYVSIAENTAHQARMSAIHATDTVGFCKTVMETYNSLTEEQRQLNGTEEYRALFTSRLNMVKGGTYDVLVHLLDGTRTNNDVYDVYIAMYDREHSRIVYVVDADPDPETALYPGEWEPVNKTGMDKFLDWDGNGRMYDIDWTEKYGLLSTVALPIEDKNHERCAFMLVDISIKEVTIGVIRFALRLLFAFSIVTLILAWAQTRRINKNLVDPINSIADAARNYVSDKQKGISDKEHFASLDIKTGDEIEKLGETMRQMEKDMAEYEDNLAKITAEKERISTELALAKGIQAAMIPHEFPPFPDRNEFDIFATMEPAREVGGDFYDYFLIDDDHLGLVMADVSGKGIPAALFMMIAKTILQSCAMLGRSAAETLGLTNEAISSNNQTDMFVTVWFGILEISSGKLTCSNAGHEYPAFKSSDGEFELLKEKHGFVIGGMEGTKYREYTMELKPGDKFFIYTDGVPEAVNDDTRMYGVKRMLAALNKEGQAHPKDILTCVREDLREFVKDAEQFDDLTMLCLEYYGPQN